jgi:hypothetical protein
MKGIATVTSTILLFAVIASHSQTARTATSSQGIGCEGAGNVLGAI